MHLHRLFLYLYLTMKKSFIYSVFSLLVIGLGLSLLGEAILMKGSSHRYWVFMGTAALIVCNTGFSLLGRAVIETIKEQSK